MKTHFDRNGQTVNLQDKCYDLSGTPLQVGQKFPQRQVMSMNLIPFHCHDDNEEKPMVFVFLPSLDTAVCDKQMVAYQNLIKKHNYNDMFNIYFITSDTPFAIGRYFREKQLKEPFLCFSDSGFHELALATGLYIPEMGVNARAVIRCDAHGVVTHIQRPQNLADIPCLETACVLV